MAGKTAFLPHGMDIACTQSVVLILKNLFGKFGIVLLEFLCFWVERSDTGFNLVTKQKKTVNF